MPTYEYRCPQGHTFDVFQRISDEPGADCPECGLAAERHITGGAGFIFKGEGFYITDSRSDAYKKEASSERGEVSAEGSSAKAASGAGDSKSKNDPSSSD